VPRAQPNTFLLEVLTEAIPPASRITLAFDLNPLAFPADGRGGTVYLATITAGPGTPRVCDQFRREPRSRTCKNRSSSESGAVKTGTGQWESATVVPTGVWTRVEVAVNFTAPNATATLGPTVGPL